MRRVVLVLLAVGGLVATMVLIAVIDGDDDERAGDATATVASGGVPVRTPCTTERPGEGVEAEEAREVQLPLPPPERFRRGTPERALAEFMDAWHDRAWDRMALWAAPSWRELTPGDEGAVLRDRYGAFRLRGWTASREEQDPSVARFRVLTAYRDVRPVIERERLLFVLNREDAAGEPVETGGRWGVFLSEKPDAELDCPPRG